MPGVVTALIASGVLTSSSDSAERSLYTCERPPSLRDVLVGA